MNNDDPATIESVSRNVVEGLAYGHFQPLPYTCFPMDKIQDAMELMKSGRHTGKILLSNLVEDGPGKGGPLTVQSYAAVRFGGEAFHLVLGAAGGVGASLITHAHTRTLTHARSHMHAHTCTLVHARQVPSWSAGCTERAPGGSSSPSAAIQIAS